MTAAHNTTKKASRRIKARKSDGTVITVKRADIYERDKWTCQLCGEPVERGAKFPAPLAPSLDHIVPLSRGGDHDITNLQTAHVRCNASRGNTPLSDPAPAVVLEGRRYLTVPEAAAAVGVPKWKVALMVSRGEIASTRLKSGGYRYVLADDIEALRVTVAERQRYFTLPEAAEAIGITYSRLDRMVRRGEVEVTRFEHSRNRYILADNIDALRGTIAGTNLPSSDASERT
jgi:5-methylcytosine-specific restriction endonuclease McrA